MKRIIQIKNVGNVAFPGHMRDAEVAQAVGKLRAQANQLAKPPWEPTGDGPS